MVTKRQQRWPLGTKIKKHFEGHGEFVGEVKSYKDGLYSIIYSEGDEELLNDREMKRYALRRPPFLPPSSTASVPAAPTTSRLKPPTEPPLESPCESGGNSSVDKNSKINHREDSKGSEDRIAKIQKDIETMHQELEVTGYARTKTGHTRKRVPRFLHKMRTKKRLALEKKDRAELAMLGDEEDDHEEEIEDQAQNDEDSIDGGARKRSKRKKRMRGAKAALDDDILHGSMVFQPPASVLASRIEDEDLDDEEVEHYSDEEEDGVFDDDELIVPEKRKPATRKARGSGSTRSSYAVKKRRQMYRLRNFQSYKMAQRHGDALAAHARGDHKVAIETLKAVAKDAPSAPQVYSSLGMVYEDMLKESKNRYYRLKSIADPTATVLEKGNVSNDEENSLSSPFIPNQLLREQCDLAKKAYGSHHVSAILCKRDFTLWVRAGDSALSIADVHEEVLSLLELPAELRTMHKAEKRRWQNEALRDLAVADNLKPPGIDIPAKLAAIHLDLGNLSEALTILTDLKNRSSSEFHSSYKAWLLYSDLMLRIGHECIQWKQGVQNNENYMVRRWLRKYSKSFDWQERRLQALAMALEAAAGTKSTREFVSWVRSRTKDKDMESVRDDTPVCPSDGHNLLDQSETPKDLQFQQERTILATKQRKELREFDQTTADMDLIPDSDPARDREAARMSLVTSHECAMGTLRNECSQQEKKGDDVDEPIEIMEPSQNALPISGSMHMVCSIAADLMKQLHGLDLYKGARLVGESVSKYMIERARRADRAINAKRKADEWHQKIIDSPFFLGSHDNGTNEESGEDESPYLSDEDTFVDSSEESPLLASLRQGALPPELKVLLAIAMIGEGDRNFVANKLLDAVDQLDEESEDWIAGGDRETAISGEPRWFLFKRAMTEKLSKTIAFAFLADVLRKTEKEAEWAVQLCSRFLSQFELLRETGVVDLLIDASRTRISANGSIRKNQVVKLMLASCKLGMDTIVERPGVTIVLGNKRPALGTADKRDIAQKLLECLSKLIPLMWWVDRTGQLSDDCVAVVRLTSRCIRWFSASLQDDASLTFVWNILTHTQAIISYLIGGNPIPELKELDEIEGMKSLSEAVRLPSSKKWQPVEFRALTDRTFNIAASCNVPPFSGWENEKFSTKLLFRRCKDKHHWLHIQNKKVTGCLSRCAEEELKRQWEIFEHLEPDLPKSDFENKLKLVKDSAWFKSKLEGAHPDVSEIAEYGEDDMLLLLLAFSRLCLAVAGKVDDKGLARRKEQLALSVLLPLRQFCLDDTILGTTSSPAANTTKIVSSLERPAMSESFGIALANEATADVNEDGGQSTLLAHGESEKSTPNVNNDDADEYYYEEWRKEAGEAIFEPRVDVLQTELTDNCILLDGPSSVAQEVLAPAVDVQPRRRRPSKPARKPAKRDVPSAIWKECVPVSLSDLKKLWNSAFIFQDIPTDREMNEAKVQMRKVDKCLKDLRSCFTIRAAEKSCLALSVALLDLAAMPACRDPFTCLQQAAMYASQALKAGNSDVAFRRNIPDSSNCDPREALVILGRADCLHLVFFPREAAFLCSFVAQTCSVHRDQKNESYEWNEQWKVVGIYAYNVSIMIRSSVSMMSKFNSYSKQTDFSSMWHRTVVRELEKGRRDAQLLLDETSNVHIREKSQGHTVGELMADDYHVVAHVV